MEKVEISDLAQRTGISEEEVVACLKGQMFPLITTSNENRYYDDYGNFVCASFGHRKIYTEV